MDILDEFLVRVNEQRKRVLQNEMRLYINIIINLTEREERDFINEKIKACKSAIRAYDIEIEQLKKECK